MFVQVWLKYIDEERVDHGSEAEDERHHVDRACRRQLKAMMMRERPDGPDAPPARLQMVPDQRPA